MTTSNVSRPDQIPLERSLSWPARLGRALAHPKWAALIYLLALALAEAVTVFIEPRLGMLLHGLVLFALLAQAALSKIKTRFRFLVALALAPLIRLLSLTMPLLTFPFVYWYMVVGGPLLLSAILAARLTDMNLKRLGLHGRGLPLQFLVGLTGLGLGYLEYLILRPEPLAAELTLRAIWLPALVLLVFTGLLEEIIFRGLLQQTALRLLGRPGFLYVAAVFAVLHFGYYSFIDVLFVFAVALFFGWVVRRTDSIIGVTLSHGLTNISLFLLFPLLLVEPLAPFNPSPPLVASAPSITPTLTPFAPQGDTYLAEPAQPEPATPQPSPSLTPSPSPTLLLSPTPNASPTLLPSSSPSATVCGPPADWVVYIIRPGDSLYALSLAVGLTTTELRTANCMDRDMIYTGQALYMPFQPPLLAPVQPTSTERPTLPAPPTASPTLEPSSTASATLAPSATPTSTATPSSTVTETPSATLAASPTLPSLTPTDAVTRTPAVLPTLVETSSQP